MNEKPTLNIVLVEPEIPNNTGAIARTCACTACRLHLVGPMGFAIDDKKLKHAGLDYWHYLDISYYDSLDEFFAKNSGPYYYFTTKAPQRYTDVSYPDGAYLVFGREDAGLPEELLAAHEADCVRMPMRRGERCHVAQHALYACGIGRREIVVTFQQRECGRLLFGVEIRFVHFGL